MRYALTHFLTFSPETVTEEVYWALAGIYAVLVVVSASSIFSLKSNFGVKLAWFVLIVALPVIGMTIYCVRCLIFADYSLAKQFGFGFRRPSQSNRSNIAKSTTAMLK
ncbi:MAG: PLDc_N domain-containing protein [Verrucomicrobia bacterium]|nr:PLDc_N domain-containing protein [Verrucomicrobiota bacterium]